MAELACYTNAPLTSIRLTASAVARGLRVSMASTGLCAVAASTVRGDYVMSQAGAASQNDVAAFQPQAGGITPYVADGAISIGDTIYSAASGKVGKTSTSTVIIGIANTAASGDGILFEVINANPL